jgi:hypothetical protein
MQVREIIEKLREIAEQVPGKSPILDAYLYRSRNRCGKLRCRCMTSNYRHEAWCLSYTQDGKSRTRTIPFELLATLRQMTANYREMRQARREFEQLQKVLLKLLDSATKREILAGRKLYERLMAQLKQ